MNLVFVEQYLDLKFLKQVLIALTGLALLGMMMDLGIVFGRSYKPASLNEIAPLSQPHQNKPLADYESALQAGGLFGTKSSEGLTALRASITELVKDYRLQGVVILDQPEAILQDARTQQTIFVKAGQQLGELQVKEIKEGAVVLTCYGEETVLQIQ